MRQEVKTHYIEFEQIALALRVVSKKIASLLSIPHNSRSIQLPNQGHTLQALCIKKSLEVGS